MHTHRRILVAAVALAAAVGGFQAAGAHGTAPGHDGRIAFMRYRLQNSPLWSEIWVTDVDGTHEHRVSHAPEGDLDAAPDWAPDGSRIAFQRCPQNDGRCTVWTVKPDGSEETRLSPSCPPETVPPVCPDDANPAYSPDSRSLAFVRYGRPALRGLV